MKRFNLVETEKGIFHIVSKRGEIIRFLLPYTGHDAPGHLHWKNLSDLFRDIECAGYKHTFARSKPDYKYTILAEENNLKSFKEKYPEYLI